MIRFKVDIIKELKEAGYNSTRMRREKIMSQGSMTDMRKGICPGMKTLNTICKILGTQPGVLIEYVPDEDE